MSLSLIRYDAACRALSEAKAVDEAKDIRDKAEAMRAYARQARNHDLEVDAAEIRFRAERRLGELIQAQKKGPGLNSGSLRRGSREEPRDARPTLADAGIDKKLSSRAQKLAAVPDAEFEGLIGEWRGKVAEETGKVSTRLLKAGELARELAEREANQRDDTCTVDDFAALGASGKKFGAILADPPWTYKVYSGKGKARSAERQYDTMTLDDIKALPVASLAADDCALFMWATMPQLPEAFGVINAWGFEYKTCGFCWTKLNETGRGYFVGMGYWTRSNAELCLLATRGNPKRLHMDVQQVIVSPVMEHSRKPGVVHERIERLVSGPYLEMFGRRITPGWTVWGNEIERRLFDGEVREVA